MIDLTPVTSRLDIIISRLDTIIRDIAGLGSGGSDNSDIIGNADKNAQDIKDSANQNAQDIQDNANQNAQDIKDNADQNAQDIQNNQDANTDKITNKLEETKNGIISGLIEGIKGLFLPSDGYFSDLFNRLNNFFKDKFGFLYTPIDLLIRFCDVILGAGTSFTGIPIPEIAWEGQVLISAQTVGFDFLGNSAFAELQAKLYFVTNVIMVGALIALIHRKFDEVMRN